MQAGGERYGMGAAEMHTYMPAVTGPSITATGGNGARGLSHLFGHLAPMRGSGDVAGLHTLQLHRPSGPYQQQAAAEQEYLEQLSAHQQQLALRGSSSHQAAVDSHHYVQQQHAGLQAHHSVASFFKAAAAGAAGLGPNHPEPADTMSSHSFFNMASAAAQEQFKLSTCHGQQQQQLQLGNSAVEDEASAASGWRSDETAALLKLCSDVDPASKVVPAVWDDVARKLQEMGYQRSPHSCKEKFDSLQACSRRAKEESQRRELEFSSDFSSEGGHAANLQTSENYDNNDEDDDIIEDENNNNTGRDHNPYHNSGRNGNPKKRKMGSASRAPTKSFFESLAREIIDKQEELHRAFLDTMERKDRERAMREEVYRRQEAARLDREQEIRAQEIAIAASRDAALIAFLEKATGQPLSNVIAKAAGLPVHVVPPLSSTPASAAAGAIAAAYIHQVLPSGDHSLLHHHQALQDASDMDNNSDVNTKRWPKVEVHALIRLRSGMEPRFREAGPKAHLWQEISASMACLGFGRSPKRCKEKWENINKYFKKTKDSSKKRPENAKTCPYFHQLDTLYQRGILTSSSSSTGAKLLIGKSDNYLEYSTQDDANGLQMQEAEAMNNEKETNLGEMHNSEQQAREKNLHNDQVDKFLHHHGDGFGVNAAAKKSLQVELFVKDILDLQQQQHQKLVEEYDRMEQAHELRELERQQIKTASTLSLAQGGSGHDSAALMALVHKMAGDSSDLSMSAPSSMD